MKKIKIMTQPLHSCEEIYVDHDIMDVFTEKVMSSKYDKMLFVADKYLFRNQSDYIRKLMKTGKTCGIVFLKPKPHYKDFRHCEHLIKKLMTYKLDRKSCLVAIGGGFVADMVGFISAIYMRGIDFIQIPTTMMGMSDSVIGKVAVNFNGRKNLLGNFYSPKFVFVNTDFLKTLPEIEIVYGLVEVWKHALLVKENHIIQIIESYLSGNTALDEMLVINFSLKTKKRFVEKDYNDMGGAHKALSLGHTLANYFESAHGLRHAPAVFYGIIFAALLSRGFKLIDKKNFKLIMQTAKLFENRIGLFNKMQKKLRIPDVVTRLKFDKINHGDFYTFVVLTNQGFSVKNDIETTFLNKILEQYKNFKI